MARCHRFVRWLMVIVALTSAARGDISIAVKPERPSEAAACVAVLERARDTLARIDPRFAGGQVRTWTQMPSEADYCDRPTSIRVTLESAAGAAVQYSATAGIEVGDRWNFVQIDRQREMAHGVLQHGVDTCLAVLPDMTLATISAAPNGLSEGERAAFELQKLCRIEGTVVGLLGRIGRTRPRLRRIAALGAGATPLLVRLAHSANPAARSAAALGLGGLANAVARAELTRLSTDEARVETLYGCIGGVSSVAQFARDALAGKTVPNQDRR